VADVQLYDLALADWTVQGLSPQGNIEVPASVPGIFLFLKFFCVPGTIYSSLCSM